METCKEGTYLLCWAFVITNIHWGIAKEWLLLFIHDYPSNMFTVKNNPITTALHFMSYCVRAKGDVGYLYFLFMHN